MRPGGWQEGKGRGGGRWEGAGRGLREGQAVMPEDHQLTTGVSPRPPVQASPAALFPAPLSTAPGMPLESPAWRLESR